MKGKSLRGILILALVVCAQLAVASQAFAVIFAVPPVLAGETRKIASYHPLNTVGYDRQKLVAYRPAAWMSVGHARVTQDPWKPAVQQTVYATVYIQRWTSQNWAWVSTTGWNLQPITFAPYDSGWKYFWPRTIYLASGYYYRARILFQWYRTNGSRLGAKWIGSNSGEYYQAFVYSVPTLRFNPDPYAEGWVYYPVWR